ncbi:MAG: sulfatase [Planctomycetes bacterium]|nr:sulfatase [Planctomycetota bacterium]
MKAFEKKSPAFLFVLLPFLLIIAGILSYFALRNNNSIRNVILISIDTCRADYLSCYGFDLPTTPQIDQMAQHAILFQNAHTPVPLTLPAHCSLFTGTYPLYHRIHDNYQGSLGQNHITLAEILKDNGYNTGAVIGSFVLDQQFGTDQGFDSYQDKFNQPLVAGDTDERRAEQTSSLACEFIEDHQDAPFFLFLHYFDPHIDYEPPEPFSSRFSDNLYAGEIAYTDRCIGHVLDQLKKLNLDDSTMLVIVGDHGESLGEHGESTHGYYIYQSTIHIPYIIKVPGISSPKIINENVSLVDVMPTILGCIDLPIPDQVQGKDLSKYFQKETPLPSKRHIFTESIAPDTYGCNPLLGILYENWSYIHTVRPELYDLLKNPGN